MDYIRRSLFRQPEHPQDNGIDRDVEWQPQHLGSHPEMDQQTNTGAGRFAPSTRQRFSSLFTRGNNQNNNNAGIQNKYAVGSTFGESTDNLANADGPLSPPHTQRGRFSHGVPSLQLPGNIGLVGHSRFSEQSSAPPPARQLFTSRFGGAGARAASSVYPATECRASDFVPPLVMEPMPTYAYNLATTTTHVEAAAAARSQRKLDRQHRHHPRHQHRRKKHGSKTSGSGRSKHRHHQSSPRRHHDLSTPPGSAGGGNVATESSLSSSTDATGTTNTSSSSWPADKPRRHKRSRSPPVPFLGCFPPVRSSRMRARIVQCLVAGLFVVLMTSTYLGLALTNAVDPGQLTVPMAIIVAVTAVVLVFTTTRLCMLIVHKRRKAKDRARRRGDVEAQQKQQVEKPQPQSAYAYGGFAIPREPIPVVLTRDEQASGLDSGVAKVEPPAYGQWRESMRMDPNRVYWQRNEHSAGQVPQHKGSAAQTGFPPQPDYANHPAMAATPVITNDHAGAAARNDNDSYNTYNHYNHQQDDIVSDLGSSGVSGYSPNPSAVSSPSVVYATTATYLKPDTYTYTNNNANNINDEAPVPATPMTVWPRPPSYMSDNAVTPNRNHGGGRDLTAPGCRNSLGLLLAAEAPNPPPTLMQLPSDISLFTTSQQRTTYQQHQQDVAEVSDSRFHPAYYVPDPRDTRAHQAAQQQDYYIDLAASSAVASRAQSPVNIHHHRRNSSSYGGTARGPGNNSNSNYVPPVAESECGTIAVGITPSQYAGGTRCNSTVFGRGGAGGMNDGSNVQEYYEDEIVYDDEHDSDGVEIDIRLNNTAKDLDGTDAGEVAYIDVEVLSSDDEEERPTSKGSGSRKSRKEAKSKGKGSGGGNKKKKTVDGTPLIGQLGGAHGWS